MRDVKTFGAINGPDKPRKIASAAKKQQMPGYSCEHPTGGMSWGGHDMHKEHKHKYVK